MTALIIIGIAMAFGGICTLGWCILQASRLQKGGLDPAEAKSRMRVLIALNIGAVSTGFLGAALVLLGFLLEG